MKRKDLVKPKLKLICGAKSSAKSETFQKVKVLMEKANTKHMMTSISLFKMNTNLNNNSNSQTNRKTAFLISSAFLHLLE